MLEVEIFWRTSSKLVDGVNVITHANDIYAFSNVDYLITYVMV